MAFLVVSAFMATSAMGSEMAEHKLVRRHNDAVQMGAHGDMKVVDEPKAQSKPEQAVLHFAKSKTKDDICNDNFTEGLAMKNNCTEPDHQFLIEEKSLCAIAAKASLTTAGVACGDACIGSPFQINSYWFDKHPMRCFIEDNADNTHTEVAKWYFNPSGYVPTSIISGTPVCIQPEYHEGPAGGNDCVSTEYSNIMDESECRQAATCLASCIHDEFRVLDAATMASSPKGCHNSTLGCLRFNTATTDPTPTGGTPICMHKNGNR